MRIVTWIYALMMLACIGQMARAQSPEKTFEIELNGVEQIDNSCRITFVAVNNLGALLDKTSIEIGVFDKDNVFSEMVVFDFGRLPMGKTRVVQYDLPRKCETISRLLLNSFKDCSGATDLKQLCEDSIRTKSQATMAFGQ